MILTEMDGGEFHSQDVGCQARENLAHICGFLPKAATLREAQ